MVARIVDFEREAAPLRIVLGSQALDRALMTLRKRIAGFEAQIKLAASTDFPPRSDQHPRHKCERNLLPAIEHMENQVTPLLFRGSSSR